MNVGEISDSAKVASASLMKTVVMIVALWMSAAPVHAVWQSRQFEDPITNKQHGHVMQAIDGQSFAAGCLEDLPLMVVFYWKNAVANDVRMNIRLDQGEVMPPVAMRDPENNSTFLVSKKYTIELLRAMRSARQLHVRVALSNGSMMPAVSYGLDGFSERLQSACGWHPGYRAL